MLLGAVCFTIAVAAPLQAPVPVPANANPQVSAEIDALRRVAATREWTELWKQASDAGERLAKSAHASAVPFSRIAVHRAIAQWHLGDDRDALWHWQVALNLSEDHAIDEMARFPDAAARFAAIGLPTAVSVERERGVTLAKPLKTFDVNFLVPRDNEREPLSFVVQLVVGADGVPHSPRVTGETRGEVDRVYSALEALRQWRFTPATRRGVAIESPLPISLTLGRVR